MKKYLKLEYIYLPISLILTVIIFYFMSMIYMDGDVYFMIATGREIIKNGIPSKNPFTFINDLDIIIQQWPYAIILSLFYDNLGYVGIYICSILQYFVLFFSALYYSKINKSDIRISCMGVPFILLLCSAFLSARPIMLTMIILLWENIFVEKYLQSKRKRFLVMLVFLSIIMINMHAALWFFLFIFLLPYIVPPIKNPFIRFKDVSGRDRLRILKIVPLMVFAGFINPYGLNSILYISNSFNDMLKNAGIDELRPLSTKNIYLYIIIVLCISLYIYTRNKAQRSEAIYLLCGTLLMSLGYLRNIIYFFYAVIIFLLTLEDYNIYDKMLYYIRKSFKYTVHLMYILFLVTSVILGSKMYKAKCFNPVTHDSDFTCYNIVEYLDENASKSDKIFNIFNLGGYLEFNGYRCFIDQRPELFFKSINHKEDIFQTYIDLEKYENFDEYDKFVRKYDFKYFITADWEKIDFYLNNNSAYTKVISGKYWNLYEKIE